MLEFPAGLHAYGADNPRFPGFLVLRKHSSYFLLPSNTSKSWTEPYFNICGFLPSLTVGAHVDGNINSSAPGMFLHFLSLSFPPLLPPGCFSPEDVSLLLGIYGACSSDVWVAYKGATLIMSLDSRVWRGDIPLHVDALCDWEISQFSPSLKKVTDSAQWLDKWLVTIVKLKENKRDDRILFENQTGLRRLERNFEYSK